MATRDGTFTIVQISDLHCGTQFFLPNLLERAITEVNDLQPEIVVISGDLTTFGFKEEYALAKQYVDTIECEAVVVIPGNHDSRNVGLRPLRGAVRRPELGRAGRRRDGRRRGLD